MKHYFLVCWIATNSLTWLVCNSFSEFLSHGSQHICCLSFWLLPSFSYNQSLPIFTSIFKFILQYNYGKAEAKFSLCSSEFNICLLFYYFARSEELETALMEMVRQDNRRLLSARVRFEDVLIKDQVDKEQYLFCEFHYVDCW